MLLKKTLRANAGFSFLSGLLLVSVPSQTATLLGDLPTWLLIVVGSALILFALDVYWISRQLPKAFKRAQIIFWADVAWVLLTPLVIFLFFESLSNLTKIILIDVAVIVAAFAFAEWKGLQQLSQRFA